MRRASWLLIGLLCVATLLLPGDSARAGGAVADLFQIVTGYAAKESCSCALVVGQTDEYCQAFGQIAAGLDVAVAIDHQAQTVTATLGDASRTARATAGAGCVLDGLP